MIYFNKFINLGWKTCESEPTYGSSGNNFILTGWMNDRVFGGAGNDYISTFAGNDYIDAGSGNDHVHAGFGDDTILGGAGNDYIDGFFGFDKVVYKGSVDDYQVERVGSWFTTKYSVRALDGSLSDFGVDNLEAVEALYFEESDYTYYLGGCKNNAVFARDDKFSIGEDDALNISVNDLIANDSEFDGDKINVSSIDSVSMNGIAIDYNPRTGEISYNPGDRYNGLDDGEERTDTFKYFVNDGRGGASSATVTIKIRGENDAPTLSGPASVEVAEGTRGVVADFSATDPEGQSITYSLSGADAKYFAISKTTGEVVLVDRLNYEAPSDNNRDNVFELKVIATDSGGLSDQQDLDVILTDVNETGLGRVADYSNYDQDDAFNFDMSANSNYDPLALEMA